MKSPNFESFDLTVFRDRQPKKNPMDTDFISLGVLPLPRAEILFESFNNTMNQLLWSGIVLKHPNLDSV
jgi:hypothetical protein